MDSQGRIYLGSNSGGTPGSWESGSLQYWGEYPAKGFMRIVPNGGSLTVVPPLTSALNTETGSQFSANVFAAGGMVLPEAFTVSTTTPWFAVTATGSAIPLPNWYDMLLPPAQGVINVTADPTLAPGTYDGSVTVIAPGMTNSPLTVPVHYVVPASTGPFPRSLFPRSSSSTETTMGLRPSISPPTITAN